MKIANTGVSRLSLLQALTLLPALLAPGLPAAAQQAVTVPPATAPGAAATPATMPSPAPATPAATVAADPLVQPAMPSAAPAPAPAANGVQAAVPAGAAPGVVTPVAAAVPNGMPVVPAPNGAPAAVTAPPATLPNMPQGTPSVVTQVMQNLKSSERNISVEDMSKAEDALARLDLLLQIEKKVGEIKKAQDDRDSSGPGMSGSMSPGAAIGQVPASALVLPGQSMNMGMGAPGMGGMNGATPASMGGNAILHSAPASASEDYQIEQILGTNGNYSAVLTTSDGDRKTVRVGDKLNGRMVQSISLDGIELGGGKNKKTKKLTIKNDGVLLSPTVRD